MTLASVGVARAQQGQGRSNSESAAPVVVWRCPGPPVLYTDRLSAAQAQAQGCTVLQDVPVASGVKGANRVTGATGVKGGERGGVDAPSHAGTAPAGTPTKVTPAEQQERDEQARRILQAELRREEHRLTTLDPSQAEVIRRTRADIDAIRRELARLR